MEDRELKDAIIELTMAQKQTSKNLDTLRVEFREIVRAVSQMSALQTELTSAHARIKELKADTKEDLKSIDAKFMKWMWALLGLLGTSIGVLVNYILNMKG